MDEWKLLANDDTRPEWACDNASDMSANPVSVDVCWSYVFKRQNVLRFPKYPTLQKVVKACLALPHGNADAERSFSFNKNIVTSERNSMINDTICAIRMVKDGVKHFGGSSNVYINSDLLNLTRSAYSQYKKYLDDIKKAEEAARHEKELKTKQLKEREEQKQKKEAAAKAKRLDLQKLEAKESEINCEQEKMHSILKTSSLLLKEAEDKLKSAITTKDMDQIAVAQAMLQAANQKISSANSSIQANETKRKEIISRKRELDELYDHGEGSSSKKKSK
jgi:hypothetical protein